MKILSVVQKKRLKRAIPQLSAALAVLFFIAGVLGVIVVQEPLREQSQDTRSEASIADGTVFIRSPQNGQSSAYAPNTERVLQLEIKAQAEQLQRIHLVFNIVTDVFEPPLLKVPTSSSLQIISQELERTADGYLVSSILEPKTTEPFVAVNWEPLTELHYTPVRGGTIALVFDTETSTAITAETNLDKLKHVERIAFTITGGPAATQAVPSGVGGPVVDSCNNTCVSNAECGINQRCFDTGTDKRCRLVTNVSSTTCAGPEQQSANRTCNEYCADSRECAAGYACWYNLCRHPLAVESVSCAAPTAAQEQVLRAACNSACSSNDDCTTNLRCFSGSCRLATNPSSTSCSLATTPTVTNLYPDKGGALTPPVTSTPRPVVSAPPTTEPIVTPTPSIAPISEEPAEPEPTPSPATPIDPDESVTQKRSALDDFFALLEDFDIRAFIPGLGDPLDPNQKFRAEQLLPFIALGIGALLVLIASIFFLRSFMGTRKRAAHADVDHSNHSGTHSHSSSVSDSTQATTGETYQPSKSPSQSAPATPLPAVPGSPIPRTTKHLGVQPASAPPSKPVHHGQVFVQNHSQSDSTTVATPSTAPKNSAMLERLKAKGVQPPK